MKKVNLFNFVVEKEKNQIRVERSFQADLNLVWAAWTQPEIIDRWWAPQPYQCITRVMDLKDGGRWHYYMKGPEGDLHWCLMSYESVRPKKILNGISAFCDDKEIINLKMPVSKWETSFLSQGEETLVNIVMSFEKLEDLETILAMGMQEGLTAALESLQLYFEKKKIA